MITDISIECSHVVCVHVVFSRSCCVHSESDTHEQHWLMQARVLVVLCFTRPEGRDGCLHAEA